MLSKYDLYKIVEILIPSKKNKVYESYKYTQSELLDNWNVVNSEHESNDLNTVIWFLPKIENVNAGGIVTVLKLAQYLSEELGVDNIFAFDANIDKSKLDIIELLYPSLKYQIYMVDCVSQLPNACVGICTFWTTAFSLFKYNKCRKKFYLLQDDERSFYAKGSLYNLVESTYRFGFTGISNSFLIKNIYQEISGKECIVYRPGVDASLLNLRYIERPKDKIHILVYARPEHQRNCFETIIVSLKSVAEVLGSDYIFHLVGANFSKRQYGLGKQFVVHGNMSDRTVIKELYALCSFGISFISSPTYSYHQLDIISSGICLISNINAELQRHFDEDCVYFIGASVSEIEMSLPDILIDRKRAEEKITNSHKAISQFSWKECGRNVSIILRS